MGVRLPSVFAVVAAAIQTTAAAETVAVITPPINIPLDSAAILLYWWLDALANTGATSGLFRIRRGSGLGGTVLQLAPQPDTFYIAGAGGQRGGCYVDVPGNVAEIQYTLTFQNTGQSGNGQIRDGCLIAMVL